MPRRREAGGAAAVAIFAPSRFPAYDFDAFQNKLLAVDAPRREAARLRQPVATSEMMRHVDGGSARWRADIRADEHYAAISLILVSAMMLSPLLGASSAARHRSRLSAI